MSEPKWTPAQRALEAPAKPFEPEETEKEGEQA